MENYKTLMKEIKEIKDIKEIRDIPCEWTVRPNIKISILPNVICRFDAILFKITRIYIVEIKLILISTVYMERQIPRIAIIIVKKMLEASPLSSFKT